MADLGALMSGVLHMMRLIWGLPWGVIKYLHWETKWLTNSMTSEDFLEF